MSGCAPPESLRHRGSREQPLPCGRSCGRLRAPRPTPGHESWQRRAGRRQLCARSRIPKALSASKKWNPRPCSAVTVKPHYQPRNSASMAQAVRMRAKMGGPPRTSSRQPAGHPGALVWPAASRGRRAQVPLLLPLTCALILSLPPRLSLTQPGPLTGDGKDPRKVRLTVSPCVARSPVR